MWNAFLAELLKEENILKDGRKNFWEDTVPIEKALNKKLAPTAGWSPPQA